MRVSAVSDGPTNDVAAARPSGFGEAGVAVFVDSAYQGWSKAEGDPEGTDGFVPVQGGPRTPESFNRAQAQAWVLVEHSIGSSKRFIVLHRHRSRRSTLPATIRAITAIETIHRRTVSLDLGLPVRRGGDLESEGSRRINPTSFIALVDVPVFANASNLRRSRCPFRDVLQLAFRFAYSPLAAQHHPHSHLAE